MKSIVFACAALSATVLCASSDGGFLRGAYYDGGGFRLGSTNVVSGTLRLGVADGVAYSRYRFLILDTAGSNADCAQISEFRLLSDGTDVTPRRTRVSASSGGAAPGNAVDGDLVTQFSNSDAAAGSANEAYLELEFAGPIAVTHYAFATPDGWCRPYTDGVCRTPTSFRLLGSNDGLTWTLLDERLTYQPTWLGMAWTPPIPLGGADLLANAAVTVGADGTLDVRSSDARVGSLASATGTVNIAAGGRLRVGFPGAGGATFYQLVIRRKSPKYKDGGAGYGDDGDYHSLAMSEFALFDAAGTQVNAGLTQVSMTDAWNLQAGTCCVDASFTGLGALFDGDLKTGWEIGGTASSLAYFYNSLSASSWLRIYLRLADGASPVAAYNLATYGWGALKETPDSWSLYASADGRQWTLLDARDAYAFYEQYNSWYRQGTHFPIPAAANDVVDGRKLTGSGTLEIVGSSETGTALVTGSDFDGTVRIAAGHVTAGTFERKYFKFVVKRNATWSQTYSTKSWPSYMQLGELSLFAADGTRQNLNLSYDAANPTTAPQDLAPGACSMGADYAVQSGTTTQKSVARLFDGDSQSYWHAANVFPNDGSTHEVVVYMRLKEDAKSVTAYSLHVSFDDPNSNPTRWKLYSSADGADWTLVHDADTAWDPWQNYRGWGAGNQYGKAPYALTSGDSWPGASKDCGSAAFEVCAGARLTFGSGATVRGLVVDCAGAGTIANFRPGAAGTINLVNRPAGGLPGDFTLPLTFESPTGVGDMSGWKVLVNGRASTRELRFDGSVAHVVSTGTRLLLK